MKNGNAIVSTFTFSEIKQAAAKTLAPLIPDYITLETDRQTGLITMKVDRSVITDEEQITPAGGAPEDETFTLYRFAGIEERFCILDSHYGAFVGLDVVIEGPASDTDGGTVPEEQHETEPPYLGGGYLGPYGEQYCSDCVKNENIDVTGYDHMPGAGGWPRYSCEHCTTDF